MSKLFKLLFVFVLFTGCYYGSYTPTPTFEGYYIVVLNSVERPAKATEQYGESVMSTIEEDEVTKYIFEDEMISVVWLPLTEQFTFVLQNKTDHSIKIIWDEAVYVDENGVSSRVMHSGVKYTDRSNPQPPTVVVRNAKIEDLVCPVDNITYSSYLGWNTDPLFDAFALSQEQLEEDAQKYIGKEVQILLPLKIEDTVNEYIFSFVVESFHPNQ